LVTFLDFQPPQGNVPTYLQLFPILHYTNILNNINNNNNNRIFTP